MRVKVTTLLMLLLPQGDRRPLSFRNSAWIISVGRLSLDDGGRKKEKVQKAQGVIANAVALLCRHVADYVLC